MIRIRDVGLDIRREPLIRAFGFKGAAFTEKWLADVALTDDSGHTARGIGGFAVLWSDARVFLDHTETGGNLMMAALLEHALKLSKEISFDHPSDLLDALLEPVHTYGQQVTRNPNLRRTFTLNALVALDNAAWLLYAARHGSDRFESLIPVEARPALAHRHDALACIPLLSYGVDMAEVRKLVEAGHFILKIKLGATGDPTQMLEADLDRLRQIHATVGEMGTPHTADGRIRYYLDANGRYPGRDWVRRLMDGIDHLGMRKQVLLLEEPLPEHCRESVSDLGVTVAADESLHSVEDVRERIELGYSALALKPAGKTLTVTLRMAAEAHRLDMHCFVADSACTPRMMDWNRQVAARLAPLPGLSMGCLESNGAQHYRRWDAMVQAHPMAGAPWLTSRAGIFQLDETFYSTTGGLLPPRAKEVGVRS